MEDTVTTPNVDVWTAPPERRIPPPVPSRVSPRRAESPQTGDVTARLKGHTILLVEDESMLQDLLKRYLEDQGCLVLSACDGPTALSLAADCRRPIAVVVTDVVMPQMDGFTLAELLVEAHPETRVLFISGHADQSARIRRELRETRHVFLLKPFTQDRFLQVIREQLDM